MLPFPVPSPGDKLSIPADLYRRMMEAVDYVERLKRSPVTAILGGGSQIDSGIVRVTNASGANQPQFAVLGIDGVFPTPAANLDRFKARPALRGITPDIDKHCGKFVILQRPLKAGQIGPAVLSGASVCKLEVNSESDTCAEIIDEDPTKLETGGGATEILWKESGTGAKWGIVRLNPTTSVLRWGKIDAQNVKAGETCTVSLWQKEDGGWQGWDEDSGQNIEDVYCPPTNPGLPRDCLVLIGQINGRWIIHWPQSVVIAGLTVGAVQTTTGVFNVDNVTAIEGSTPISSSTDQIPVNNAYAWAADDNAPCEAVWHPALEAYRARQVKCPAA